MSLEFLKALLDYNFYSKYKSSISQDFVPKEYYDLYNTIIKSHDTNNVTLTVSELKALHKASNPVMSRAKEEALNPLYSNLESTAIFNEAVQQDIINKKITQRISDQIATVAIKISSGESSEVSDLQTLLDKLKSLSVTSEEAMQFDVRKIDIVKLVKTKKNSLRWKFNFPDLQDRIAGFGEGYFGVIAARPDAGKTSFHMSISCAPGGFLSQGAKVHVIGNEESVERLKFRALSALTGHTTLEIEAKSEELQNEYKVLLNNLYIVDGFGMTTELLDNYCNNNEVDILIIDQLDKLGTKGNYGTSEERLRIVYTKAREIAKRHSCGVIGICQAGAGAHNKLYYGFEHLDGSKTGKAAECDWCITIGMEIKAAQEDNYFRVANIPKNKITGKKAPVNFILNPEISRLSA